VGRPSSRPHDGSLRSPPRGRDDEQ